MEAVKLIEEAGIQDEVEALRGRFPNTQELYREVCVLLFFRYGITPTANKLYQLVKKGSMSAPAEALSKFWADLRDKSRIRVDHADLPEEIRTLAGELIGTLWNRALAQANDSLANIRADLSKQNEAATARAEGAEQALADLTGRLGEAASQLANLEAENRRLEQRLAAEAAARETLEKEIVGTRQTVAELRQSADEARTHFAAELEKMRDSHAATVASYAEALRQRVAELEQERTLTTELRKTLDDTRASAANATEAHRAEVAVQTGQIAELSQQLGRAEGELKALAEVRAELAVELGAERASVADLTHRLAAATREADRWQLKTIEAHREIEVLKAARLRKATRTSDPELDLGGPPSAK